MDQNIRAKNLLLYTFLGVYALTAIGTLSMLFFGLGDVHENERSILINSVLVETAVAIIALFYSVWNINKTQESVLEHTKELMVNPLEESFRDLVIPIESLKLPRIQLHEGKHFKRCKFIGPGAISFMGCNLRNISFIECGDIIPVPRNTYMTGIIALKDCTVEDCEFLHTTLLLEEGAAADMARQVPGMKLAGA